MAAISKAWVVIADGAVDPDSPLDTTLITGLRDNEIHLREWLGASFTGGAVQDHDHDGVNSQLIEIGPSYVRNGSFDLSTSGWVITPYTGGTVARNTANHAHGQASLGFTSTVLANGGGDAVQGAFFSVGGNEPYPFDAWIWASVEGVSSQLEVLWYDNTQALISSSVLFTSASTPTPRTRYTPSALSPATARYAKLKFTGGVPAVGTATGTVFLDGVAANQPPGLVNPVSFFKRGALGMAQNQTFYGQCVGKAADGTESNGEAYVWEPMTLSELRVVASGAVPAANSAVFTVRKNGADTALTATIGGGATAASDVTHSVDFSQGDRFSIKIVASAAAGTNDYQATVRASKLGTTIGLPYLQFSGAGDGGAGVTVSEVNGGTDSVVQSDVPLPRCLVSYPVYPSEATAQAWSLLRNAVAVPALWFLDTTTAVLAQLIDNPRHLFADMDLLSLSASATTGFLNAAIKLKSADPATYDPCPLLFSSRNQAQATTVFSGGFGGNNVFNATENKVQIAMPACSVKNLRASTDAAPPAGQTVTLTLRKNGVDTGLTCQITSAGRSASDLSGSHAVTFAAGDLLSLKSVTSATTGTRSTNASVEAFV